MRSAAPHLSTFITLCTKSKNPQTINFASIRHASALVFFVSSVAPAHCGCARRDAAASMYSSSDVLLEQKYSQLETNFNAVVAELRDKPSTQETSQALDDHLTRLDANLKHALLI